MHSAGAAMPVICKELFPYPLMERKRIDSLRESEEDIGSPRKTYVILFLKVETLQRT